MNGNSETSDVPEPRIRHLEMIQGVINRMASNSFALKALSGTITAAVIAYAAATKDPARWFVVAGILPAVIFWAMDAKYLRLEKMFRSLYDDVRKGVVTEPFDMNFMRYDETVDELAVVAFSWSVGWFYLTLVVMLVVLSILNCILN